MNSSLHEKIKSSLQGEILFEESLARHTTLKIGGPAEILFYPADLRDLQKALELCKKHSLSYFILGNGSNLLVREGGIRGMVIRLGRCLNRYRVTEESEEEEIIEVEAGLMLPKLVEFSKQKGLTGLESLYGIPGTLGGALVMNAGTREGEVGDSVVDLTVLLPGSELKTYPRRRLEFEYRNLKIPRNEIILRARLRLKKSDPLKVAEKIAFFQKRRFETQPLNQPNGGSVFKNPPKKFAAVLISELGLKGVRVGGARISEKHSNWIVNEGGATSHDVIALIGLVRDKVKETTGIRLETEIKIVGEEI